MKPLSYSTIKGLVFVVLMSLIVTTVLSERTSADAAIAEAALEHLIGRDRANNCDCLEPNTKLKGVENKNIEMSILKRLGDVKANYYDVRSGDTLDGIIQGQLDNSPVHKDILRQAIVLANPHAFRRNNPHWLYANRQIKLPEEADIHRAVFKRPVLQNEIVNRARKKSDWVRYP